MEQQGTTSDSRRLVVVALVVPMVLILVAVGAWFLRGGLQGGAPAPSPAAIAPVESAAAVMDTAGRMLAEERAGEAAGVLREAVGQWPEDRELRLALGDVLMQLGEHGEAYEQYEAALAIGPREPRIEFAAGTLASVSGRGARALEHFAAAATGDPGNADYALYLGQAQIDAGEVDAGRASLVRATVLEPERAVAWGALAELALRENKAHLALQHIGKARALEPERTAWRVIEARAHTRLGDPGSAVGVLEGLDDAGRAEPGVLAALCAAYGMRGEPALALAACERALAHAPGDGAVALEAALWAQRAGEMEKAIALAERAAMLGEAEGTDLAARWRAIAAD